MLEFIKMNIASIILVILFGIGLLFLYKKGKKGFVNQTILSLVVQAEKALGSGTGELKYAMVIENIYHKLPTVLRLLLNKKEIDVIIENSVKHLKEYLNTGRDLLGYEDEYMRLLKFKQ